MMFMFKASNTSKSMKHITKLHKYEEKQSRKEKGKLPKFEHSL